MTQAILIKLWRDSRWLLLGCLSVEFAFAMLRVWFVSRLDGSRFQQILELLPGNIQKWTPVEFDWIVSYAGRISFTFQEPIVHFCLFVWCVARGSDAISGEIDRGTMEMLLSQPLSRARYLACHVLTTLVGILAISAGLWGGLLAGIYVFEANVLEFPSLDLLGFSLPLPMLEPEEAKVPLGMLVNPNVFVPAILTFAAFGAMLAAFTTLASSFDRYRWRTIGIATSFYIVQSILKMLATAVPGLKWLQFTTIFSAFEPEKYVSIADLAPESTWSIILDPGLESAGRAAMGLGAGGSLVFFITTSLLCYGIAFWQFQRRDLPAPI